MAYFGGFLLFIIAVALVLALRIWCDERRYGDEGSTKVLLGSYIGIRVWFAFVFLTYTNYILDERVKLQSNMDSINSLADM